MGCHSALKVLFAPLNVARMTVRNRLAVAPMTRVSAAQDGLPTQRMADYYTAFAEGGFGLVIAEGLYTDKTYSQGYLCQPGLTDKFPAGRMAADHRARAWA
jgi:2,4-dienoyl-CoA reductase-like NADH-dependent reductase (Old Yellow Enzyme family)